MDNKFKELSLHCSDLSKCIMAIEKSSFDLIHVSEWLSVAAGITKVEFDSVRYSDNSILYCDSAYQFNVEREKVLNLFVNELTVFNYIWGSLEALVDFINLPQSNTVRGKVNLTCNYLKSDYEPLLTVAMYKDLIAKFNQLTSLIPYYSYITPQIKLYPHVGISGLGLYLVYKIRNKFAHGSIEFPMSHYDEDNSRCLDAELINTSSRIVLLSIQMILIALYKNKKVLIESSELRFLDYSTHLEKDEILELPLLLKTLHVVIENSPQQLKLFV